MSEAVALVMAKAPVPGQVKTRLGARVGAEAAASLAAAALMDSIDACELAFGPDRCYLAVDGDLAAATDARALTRRLRAWTTLSQRGGDFGRRLAHAHLDVAALGRTAVVQIGMDTPQATAQDLRDVADALPACDAVLGPAEDGGWWVLGLNDPRLARRLAGVAMSTARTGADTHAALVGAGARVATAATLRDVDEVEDADHVAALAPDLRFSRLWATQVASRCSETSARSPGERS